MTTTVNVIAHNHSARVTVISKHGPLREDQLSDGQTGSYVVTDTQSIKVSEVGLGTLSFGDALDCLKAGMKVARAGWNGKGMWLILVPGTPSAHLRDGTPYKVATGLEELEILPHIDMWTVNATGRRAMLPGWLASQSDMLSDDWQIIP